MFTFVSCELAHVRERTVEPTSEQSETDEDQVSETEDDAEPVLSVKTARQLFRKTQDELVIEEEEEEKYVTLPLENVSLEDLAKMALAVGLTAGALKALIASYGSALKPLRMDDDVKKKWETLKERLQVLDGGARTDSKKLQTLFEMLVRIRGNEVARHVLQNTAVEKVDGFSPTYSNIIRVITVQLQYENLIQNDMECEDIQRTTGIATSAKERAWLYRTHFRRIGLDPPKAMLVEVMNSVLFRGKGDRLAYAFMNELETLDWSDNNALPELVSRVTDQNPSFFKDTDREDLSRLSRVVRGSLPPPKKEEVKQLPPPPPEKLDFEAVMEKSLTLLEKLRTQREKRKQISNQSLMETIMNALPEGSVQLGNNTLLITQPARPSLL